MKEVFNLSVLCERYEYRIGDRCSVSEPTEEVITEPTSGPDRCDTLMTVMCATHHGGI